ncbi:MULTISPECIES: hypothetical protein [Clostridia]|jgi:hypothetical protein|uniref:Uncharacterized protein n=1 Tax=Clostridium boliviensis TaxID=318465 RepID=A0ABU4GKN1_9CLOT|nr:MULTISPECIES: hypothetical protein [Clostridia]MDK2964597.1 hypothetical protein [Lacrimispora sp.]MDW2796827.1 hypothetical protein [Clostridium boliviensis]
MIDFDSEMNEYRPSLEVDAVEDAIVRSDITDMNDLIMNLIKEVTKE